MAAVDPEGRIRHPLDVFHSTFEPDGDFVPVGYVPMADGLGQVEYVDSAEFGAEDTSLVIVAATGSTETIDCSVARTYDLTLTDNCTLTLTGAVNAEAHYLTLLCRQPAAGGPFTITWPGSVVWPDGVAPTLATDAGALDTITLLTVDGGTTWYGYPIGGDSTPAASGHGAVLLASDHAVPFTFDEILQSSDGTDFLYASE